MASCSTVMLNTARYILKQDSPNMENQTFHFSTNV